MAREQDPARSVRAFVDEQLRKLEEADLGDVRVRLENPDGPTLVLIDGRGDWLIAAAVGHRLEGAVVSLRRADVVQLRDALNDWLTR